MTDELTTDERLAQVPLFAGLSKKDLRKVSSLATRLDLPAGKELTHQGSTGNEFLIVLDGDVDVVIDGKVIASRGAGDFFGEIALLDDGPRVATVVARTPVTIEVIGRPEFKALIHDQPEIAQQLLATMAQRLAEDDLQPR